MSVENYQAALRKYKAAEGEALQMIRLIKAVSDQFYPGKFPSFIGYRFGINDQISRGDRFDSKSDIKLDDWPSVERMGEVLGAWHSALMELRTKWNELPLDNRVGFSEPPTRMDVTRASYP